MQKKYIFIIFCFFINTLSAQTEAQIKKPIIGISCSHSQNDFSSVRRTYTESVINAGGIPLLLPVTEDENTLESFMSVIEALILTGGEDVHPSYYNEEPIEQLGKVNDVRDFYDLTLIRLAAERNIPILGICRGEQLINVAFGGTLYQDIPAQHSDTTVKHNQEEPSSIVTHYISLLPGSTIANLIGDTELVTNTHHHQAVKQVAPGFRVTAWACDSIPEAIETVDGRPIWGVQFHPEGQAVKGDDTMSKFFSFITGQARLYRLQKEENTKPQE